MSAATERKPFECMSLDEWVQNGHEGPAGRDGVVVEARDPEDAAEQWADGQWTDDPADMPDDDDTLDAVVLDAAGKAHRFTCVARYSFDIIVRAEPNPTPRGTP